MISLPSITPNLDLAASGAVGPFANSSAPTAKDASTQLEGVFVSMLLKTMRESMTAGEMFGSDQSDIWGGVFDQFLGDAMAKSGGLGLTSQLASAAQTSGQESGFSGLF